MLISPYRLTVLLITSGVLTSAGYLTFGLHAVNGSPHLRIAWLALMMVGLIIMAWAGYLLRKGIRSERWPEDIVAPARRLAKRQAWAWVLGLSVVLLLSACFTGPHYGTYLWAAFIVLQTQIQLSSAFRQPGETGDGGTRLNLSGASASDSER